MTAKPVPEHISDERLAEMLAAAEKATPGRWVASEDDDADDLVSHIVRPVKVASNNVEYIDVLPRIEFPIIGSMQGAAQNALDAAYVAMCSPPAIIAILTELQHRREAEAAPVFDGPYAGPFTGPLTAGQPIRWQVKCSNIADEWFTDEGSADQWANSPGHYDAEIVVWSASPSSPASGVRVKALEWVERHDGWQADTVIGIYMVLAVRALPKPFEVLGPRSYIGLSDDEVSGKAAAQAHFDAAILSALGEHP